jgi:hypothetical protein
LPKRTAPAFPRKVLIIVHRTKPPRGHDLHDVFDLSDRVSVMKNGRPVWTGGVTETTKDQVLEMITLGKLPDGAYASGKISDFGQQPRSGSTE